MQTGNGIIFPTFCLLMKKLVLQNVSLFYEGVQIRCFKPEMEMPNEIESSFAELDTKLRASVLHCTCQSSELRKILRVAFWRK